MTGKLANLALNDDNQVAIEEAKKGSSSSQLRLS